MTDDKRPQNLALIKELEYILDSCKLELTPIAEIWPNLYIGNVAIAQNRGALQKLGITHILNAAHCKQGSIGDQSYYGNACLYCGIPAEDSSHFDISQYFQASADFIHKALKTKDDGLLHIHLGSRLWKLFGSHGLTSTTPVATRKVLVHCIMGMSRSATLVLAYLMLRRRVTLRDALKHVIQRRAIYPNRNFLALLLNLDTQLTRKRRLCPLL
ncbi:dual specificity protein phosphatase 13-like isoform X1 [Hypomesus transpacificus]|uniref:dual specificity protein phosphatase 13-like isoform X1 n=1 Tax=Hypomesus transpacificus TaxID=137520 RepID=UPI001F0760D2|nr:dual specificity protein phosphatase 13-like isoform X1 [Hypomesus transpacificus]